MEVDRNKKPEASREKWKNGRPKCNTNYSIATPKKRLSDCMKKSWQQHAAS